MYPVPATALLCGVLYVDSGSHCMAAHGLGAPHKYKYMQRRDASRACTVTRMTPVTVCTHRLLPGTPHSHTARVTRPVWLLPCACAGERTQRRTSECRWTLAVSRTASRVQLLAREH